MRQFLIGLIGVSLLAGCSYAGADPSAVPSQVRPHPPGATAPPVTEQKESFPVGQPYTDSEFWEGVVPGGDNVEHYETLADMTRAADAVIVGRITGIRNDQSRYAGVDLQGAMFATLSVSIDKIVSGAVNEASPSQLDLAIFMTDPRQYERFAARLPPERALLFLRSSLAEAKQNGQPPLPGDDHYYRVVSNQGALVDMPGGTQSASATDPFLKAVIGLPFDKVVNLVSSY